MQLQLKTFAICMLFIVTYSFAQTGIGTSTPHASAKLEVNATDKGFLPPRVTLTSSSDNSTIPNPATGLLVYNTGTNAGLRAGYYYWNGTDWTTIATASSPDQMVDYIQASLSANQTLSAAGNVNFNTSSGAGITITSGGFQLQANKTYKLEAALGGSSTGYGYYTWVDNTNAILPGSSIGVIMKAGAAFTDAPQDKAVVYYTPTANTTVYLRVINISGSIIANAPSTASGFSSTWASIQQVGSSAFVNPWVLSGNDVYNTTGNVGIGSTSPTEKLEVSGNVKATNFLGTASSSTLYLLEANASVTYTLPGSYTEDLCRYSIVNNTVNVPTSWFNTSTRRFTPQKAGYWEITASYDVYRNSEAGLMIQKNGSSIGYSGATYSVIQQVRKIVYLNGSTDYIAIFNSGASSNSRSQDANKSWFQARWLGE